VKQYQKLLKMDNVQLEFKSDAVLAIAEEAYRRKTLARRGIVEELMLDVMYELPLPQGRETMFNHPLKWWKNVPRQSYWFILPLYPVKNPLKGKNRG
jgi:hypothetical protein